MGLVSKGSSTRNTFKQLIEFGVDLNAAVDPRELARQLSPNPIEIGNGPDGGRLLDSLPNSYSHLHVDIFGAFAVLLANGLMNFGRTSQFWTPQRPESILTYLSASLYKPHRKMMKLYRQQNWAEFREQVKLTD